MESNMGYDLQDQKLGEEFIFYSNCQFKCILYLHGLILSLENYVITNSLKKQRSTKNTLYYRKMVQDVKSLTLKLLQLVI